MDEKKTKGRDYRVNIVFSFLAFTWLINSFLFPYLQLHGHELPKVLYPIIFLSFFYWLFSGGPSTVFNLGTFSGGPQMIALIYIMTAVYWWILSVWLIGKYDQRRHIESNTANQASAIEKKIVSNPAIIIIGNVLFIVFLVILIWVLFKLFFQM